MNRLNYKLQYIHKDEQFSVRLICLLIFVVAIRGLVESFIGYGTVIVDAVLILVGLYSLIKGIVIKDKIVFFYFIWILVCIINFLVQLMFDRTTISTGILALRNNVAYTLPFVFCFGLIRTSDGCKQVYDFIINCGIAICCFAIIQYLGRSFLPTKLLVIEGESVFSFWGTDVVRVTGLIGNTIIFSGFAVIMICYSWAQIINKEGNIKIYILFISSVISNLLTFSRASIVGMIVAIIVEYFILISNKCSKQEFIKRVAALMFVVVISIVLFIQFADVITNTIIFQRLAYKNNLWNEGSDSVHFSSIKKAIEVIKQHSIIGYGLGKAGYSASKGAIICDGTFWTYLIELGVPVCLLYWGIVGSIIIKFVRYINKKIKMVSSLCLGFFISNGYLIAASLINSSYSSRIILIYNWIFAGIISVMIQNSSRDEIKENT